MSSYFKLLKSSQDDILIPAWQDFMRSIPDSLFLGTAFFAAVTQSFPLGILLLSMAEFGIVNRLLGSFVGAVQGENETVKPEICSLGIPSPYQISIVGKILKETIFPSGPSFFLAAVLSYILSSTMNFNDELEELGKKEPSWASRIPLSITFSILLLFMYATWRIMNSCESAVNVIGSIGIGVIVGFLVYLLHLYLFGRNAINFLGVPILADKAASGSPLYVCAKQ